MIVAIAAGFFVPGPIRSTCVTVMVLTVPIVWYFAVIHNGLGGRGDLRIVYILTVLSYLVLYLMSWTKGRSILLAGALLFFASWISFEVAGSQSNDLIPFQGQIDNSQISGNLPSNSFTTSGSDTTNTTAATAMVIGLVFLGTGAALDRRKLRGAATPFVAVGAVRGNHWCRRARWQRERAARRLPRDRRRDSRRLVGGHGDQRRGTTWIGVLTVFGGFVAILVDIAPSSAAATGGIALGFAFILGCLAWYLAPVLGEPNDGNDRPAAAARARAGRRRRHDRRRWHDRRRRRGVNGARTLRPLRFWRR